MKDRLFEYMNRRIGGDIIPPGTTKEAGPVITISRQTGCGASQIAWLLCEELNRRKHTGQQERKWSIISREILQKSAEQLNLDPISLEHIITDKDRGMMDQIVEALSSHSHKSDKKILKTIQDVIRQFGNKGHVVIVGRGGAHICNTIQKSLHVRIEAPEDWRINEITKRLSFSQSFAKEYVKKHDTQRELLVTRLFGEKADSSVYDIHLNRSRFTDIEIVDAIIQLAVIKGLFQTH